jgi:hypothetical protein
MYDVHVSLLSRPGELARLGQAMGSAGVSLEGGGVFTIGDAGHAHFLVKDGERASAAVRDAGLDLVEVRKVLVRRLDQEKTGELGAIAAALADAGIDIVTIYSDHSNQLILVVSDFTRASAVTSRWAP